ncbi:hypothetical protein DICPUDRAFT_83616 [Dictyostelium purpureum]|uniref:Uncharacterized protein n=1 Tax=Dictyostelium purpureum TaxID=5786 RepID=F1A030_DICPU|nr:uncharacterized protein DICPUDRAFT_83616 [Dictyostelium purpureum]EGC30450.1 hypothetical protein DICPUDRAFT_83616 [Dictyostelium purpureum]|eukprot:XP_003293029.1 hypothetical protein DICPUDRAFT_83616 [Dictyostelium purpureum]
MFIILENFPCIVMQLQNSLNLNLLFQRTLKLVMLVQFHKILWEVIVIQKFCITFCISVKSCLIKKSLGFMVKRKLWNLLEIKLKADEYIEKSFFRDTIALAFSLKNSYSNNNTTTAAPEPTTFILKNSNSNYNLNSSISEYSNLNNNSTSLARSASCSSISSCNSNDINGSSSSSGCNNKNSNSFLINNETLDKFHSNRADHPKITYEVIKKCLKYSNIKDIEKLFRAISTYSAGIPFNKLSISFIWKKGLICHSVTERIDKERIEKEINYNFK